MDILRRKNKKHDWTNTGSFLNRPANGWLHDDKQLAPDAGICYGLRYVGSVEILESMKSLDFEMRTAITKESINRICCAAGFKTISKKPGKTSKYDRYIGDMPNLTFAGRDVNMTITTESLIIISMDGGDLIAHHPMPTISFASGGDVETLDYVAYVAKDETGGGRCCHVVECGGNLAPDVITTLGQAFELRFKNYLAQRQNPQPILVPDRSDWQHRDEEYYNDPLSPPDERKVPLAAPDSPHYQRPASNQPVVNDTFSPAFNHSDEGAVGGVGFSSSASNYTNASSSPPHIATRTDHSGAGGILPYNELWFHGKISRQQCDELLQHDGDFLVRESPHSSGQYVLSGRYAGHVSHLLLVDRNGQVRTKDQLFSSVSHLVNFHMLNSVPIMSADCELQLITPVTRSGDIS